MHHSGSIYYHILNDFQFTLKYLLSHNCTYTQRSWEYGRYPIPAIPIFSKQRDLPRGRGIDRNCHNACRRHLPGASRSISHSWTPKSRLAPLEKINHHPLFNEVLMYQSNLSYSDNMSNMEGN